ncbi:MAG: crotonase/enoyl-CoA hydratase family protein [Thermodesulfobacteriota bacterium]
MSDFYSVEKKGPVAYVYLNRPDKNNAMNPAAWYDSPAIFDDLDKDPEVKVVIVSGKGACFSAGIDLTSMMSALPEVLDEKQLGGVKWKFIPRIKEMQETMTCIERCRKPVIAAVHGHCIGAGLDMATACDIRICSKDAGFCLKEAAVAFVADVGVLQRIPNIIGQGITRELAYTAKTIDAKRALEINLVSEVCDDYDDLMKKAEQMAFEICENSPIAVQASKDVLNFGVGKSVQDGLNYVSSMSANIVPSKDLYEAVTAFTEKRKPKYTGE